MMGVSQLNCLKLSGAEDLTIDWSPELVKRNAIKVPTCAKIVSEISDGLCEITKAPKPNFLPSLNTLSTAAFE